jgi:hypothetical protein
MHTHLTLYHCCALASQIATNKRYAGNNGWTVSECAAKVAKDIGKIDILVREQECVLGSVLFCHACGRCSWHPAPCACPGMLTKPKPNPALEPGASQPAPHCKPANTADCAGKAGQLEARQTVHMQSSDEQHTVMQEHVQGSQQSHVQGAYTGCMHA